MTASQSKPKRLAAHTPRPGTDKWEDLDRHLAEVATLAAGFADKFGGGHYGRLLGLWHDLGKSNPYFQDYLIRCHHAEMTGAKKPQEKVPHSIWGAAFAHLLRSRGGGGDWQELALPILGHHSALADHGTAEQRLFAFEDEHPDSFAAMQQPLNDAIGLLNQRVSLPSPVEGENSQRELFVRMLFSALIDADRLATEAFADPDQNALRTGRPSISDLWERFSGSALRVSEQSDAVRRVREEVFDACTAAALDDSGMVRLTVPTGGGKTRSGLAFALRHAVEKKLDRVIVALPYTSIVDQTARVYREILGDDAVLEHHSAFNVDDDEGQDDRTMRRRFATENWDVPIVVTTTVQLFESLFTNRTSKARKLHRLAKSVIILDEIQAFPAELLRPTLDVLRLLATPVERNGYGATVVLSTATQPTFEVGPLAEVLRGTPRELVPNYEEHYRQLRRVTYYWDPKPKTWEQLASELRGKPQVLVVLNTRKDALALIDALGDEDGAVFHLSTLLCGAHRRAVLARVKQLLDEERPVKLISTQVVECGVDIDFPAVYRALGPLDRIVQAAGRCNREGRRPDGDVVIFVPAEGALPSGPYKTGTEKARLVLDTHGATALHNPEIYREYFAMLLQDVDAGGGLDKHRIQEKREAFNFPLVAKHYRLIDDNTTPVVVPYGDDWQRRLDDWERHPSRDTWQRLQPFLVNLFDRDVRRQQQWLAPVGETLYLWMGSYDSKRHRGIVAGFPDPSDLFVDGNQFA